MPENLISPPDHEQLSDDKRHKVPSHEELDEIVHGVDYSQQEAEDDKSAMINESTIEALLKEINTHFEAQSDASPDTYSMPSGDE